MRQLIYFATAIKKIRITTMPTESKNKNSGTFSEYKDRFSEEFRNDSTRKTLSKDWKSLKEFFLKQEEKERLENMGGFRKFFIIPFWLIKSMFNKLTTVRQVILVISLVLLFSGFNNENRDFNSNLIAGLLFLFLLMLELKDKLLAKYELEDGRAVQYALMPDENQIIEGWDIWLSTTPANDVGGDLVDILNMNDTSYGITLADISGKGLGAALLMTKLQATIRAVTNENINLPEFAANINKIFYRDTTRKSFASMIYFKVLPKSNEISFVNAGHIPPVFVSESDKVQFDKAAPAIGLTEHSIFIEQSCVLNTGDYLVAFSDGVSEAKNEFGEFYGIDKTIKFLLPSKFKSAEQIGKEIKNEIWRFKGDESLSDDLSIVVIKKS